ncbi:MAG: elongation factor G, partial [Myxococcota bacterium]
VVLVGHGGCGKTSLAEAMLFLSGATSRLGSTLNQTSILDFEPEEQKRQGTIGTSLAWLEHEGYKINLLDTPGDQNFIFDSFNAMRGADAAIIVLSAPDGVEVQTERVYHQARQLGLPVVFFINKNDRERADADACVRELEEVLKASPVPLQIPIGAESDFTGIVSLFQKKAMIFATDGSGKYDKTDIPAELADEAAGAWEKVVETVAETDEELLMEYLETFELSDEQVRTAFRAALKRGVIAPVIYGSATNCIGALGLMELITWALPGPLERGGVAAMDGKSRVEITPSEEGAFVAQVIRTSIDESAGKTSIFRVFSGSPPSDGQVYNTTQSVDERLSGLYALRGRERDGISIPVCGDILSVAKLKGTTGDTLTAPGSRVQLERQTYPSPMMSYCIQPTAKGGEGKLKSALERMLDEDPTLSTSIETLTHQIVLQGMGQAHLDISIARMKRKYKADVTTSLPPIPYRETIQRRIDGVEGRYAKQTGGSGQYGVCYLNVAPLGSGEGFQFEDRTTGGSIPRQLIPSVEKGIRKRMNNGFLAGYPIIDVRVEVYDGKYHAVDSRDAAFQMAGSRGLKAAFEQAGTRLLEPICALEIAVPSEVMGDIMGDITSRRGRVMGMEPKGKNTIIKALCPLAEIQEYAPLLRRMTGGKGTFTMQLASYESVPRNLIDKIVSASPFRRDDDE